MQILMYNFQTHAHSADSNTVKSILFPCTRTVLKHISLLCYCSKNFTPSWHVVLRIVTEVVYLWVNNSDVRVSAGIG